MREKLFTQTAENTDSLKAAAEHAARAVEEQKACMDELKREKRFLDELLSHHEKGWVLHIKAPCEKEADLLRRLRDSGHPCIQLVEEIYRDAKKQAAMVVNMIPSNIERLGKDRQIEIDRKSRHPRYFFGFEGFIEAKVDDQKYTATVSTREGRLGTMAADPAAILDVVEVEKKRLFERKYTGSKFLADLRRAYGDVVKGRNDAKDGDPIPIREIYGEMAKKAKGYKRDEFLVDLSALIEEGPAETSGECFDLQQTKDTKEGMLLLGAAGRGMVNLLVFKKQTMNRYD
jgi:hypothetical protein